MIWAGLYLAAVVAANLSVAIFGPASTPINAFLLIGATLTLRDRLHDKYGPRVVYILIPLGTALSLAFGPTVARFALAGALAFALSELADTAVYHWQRDQSWQTRVNRSNTISAAIDSTVFCWLAFGGFPFLVIFSTWGAKVLGGALWAYLLQRGVYDHSRDRS